jgi:hypothetical protein
MSKFFCCFGGKTSNKNTKNLTSATDAKQGKVVVPVEQPQQQQQTQDIQVVTATDNLVASIQPITVAITPVDSQSTPGEVTVAGESAIQSTGN